MHMTSSTDRIERSILLKAVQSRVWRALTNAEEFGTWFCVVLHGQRFVPGLKIRAQSLYPGYEHIVFDMWIERMEAEHSFSYRWHPYCVDPQYDYSKDATTLVEFSLTATPEGTLLKIVESGFDQISAARRLEAFRMNGEGWDEQLQNIAGYVAE
jgi:uncharacterized protein YndB with AHSA1/START domain